MHVRRPDKPALATSPSPNTRSRLPIPRARLLLSPRPQYKENETLYFQRVPPAIDLAPPAPALLVAAVPPPPELDQPEPKWFAFLGGASRLMCMVSVAFQIMTSHPQIMTSDRSRTVGPGFGQGLKERVLCPQQCVGLTVCTCTVL